MASKYNIKVKDLEQLLDIISAYAGSDEMVEFDIVTLTNAINRLKNNFDTEQNISIADKLARDISLLEEYEDCYDYVLDFLSKGLYFERGVNARYKSLYLTHDETLDLCMDFYSHQGSFFSVAMDEFYKEKKDHLKFFKPNKHSEGEMVFVQTTGDAYVLSPNYHNFKKATILIHEFEHVIDAYNNPVFYNNMIIREFAAMFMELIGCDFIAKKLSLKEDHLIRRFDIHSIVKSAAVYIPTKTEVLAFTKEITDEPVESVLKKINDKFDIDSNYLNYLLDTHLAQDYYYQISYMIAIELYTIYQADKDRALYILMDIVVNGDDENIFEYLKKHSIVLNSNVVNYENDMCFKLGI